MIVETLKVKHGIYMMSSKCLYCLLKRALLTMAEEEKRRTEKVVVAHLLCL